MLLVDDNPTLSLFTAHNLKSAITGLEVLTARSCAEGRELANRYRPQVIVVDHGLPDGSGLDLLRELRVELPTAASILISADVDACANAEKAEELEVEALRKPFEADDLIEMVRRAIGSGSGRREHSTTTGRAATDSLPDRRGEYHLLINRMSGLLAGLRAFGADLRESAQDPAAVRAITDEYVERLVANVREVSEILRRAKKRRER